MMAQASSPLAMSFSFCFAWLALTLFDYGFSENGLTAYKNGELIHAGVISPVHASSSFIMLMIVFSFSYF